MGIPRKNSRPVEVDGRNFRFMVKEEKGKPDPDYPDDEHKVIVTVQEDLERPGRVFQFKEPWGSQVSPEVVREKVRSALKAGWNTSEKGSVFRA